MTNYKYEVDGVVEMADGSSIGETSYVRQLQV